MKKYAEFLPFRIHATTCLYYAFNLKTKKKKNLVEFQKKKKGYNSMFLFPIILIRICSGFVRKSKYKKTVFGQQKIHTIFQKCFYRFHATLDVVMFQCRFIERKIKYNVTTRGFYISFVISNNRIITKFRSSVCYLNLSVHRYFNIQSFVG